MENKVIKQFAVSLVAVLSLLVSSIAACACSHHQIKAETDTPSCHQSSHSAEKTLSQEKPAAQTSDRNSFDVSCVCSMQSAPQVFGKSETLKVQKQAAVFTSEIEIVYGFAPARAPAATRFDFSKTSLADSSYNIKSPRAPPRL